jgi:diaminopimelate decarboxylase
MHTSLRLLSKGFSWVPTRSYAIYFLKGNDTRQLTPKQQEEVSDFVKRDPLSPSFIVYNRTETLRKINVFRTKLPWVNLYYAMKANPIEALLRDVVGAGGGVDCASKAEIQ